MTYKATKLVNKLNNNKHKLFKKYKSARHPAYAKAAREAAREVRRAKRNFERKLSENIDTVFLCFCTESITSQGRAWAING